MYEEIIEKTAKKETSSLEVSVYQYCGEGSWALDKDIY
jgi:hypothetical protein